MTNGNDIVEYVEANIEALVEDFVEENNTEFWADVYDVLRDNKDAFDHEYDDEGFPFPLVPLEWRIEWCENHASWGKYTEQRYAERGVE